jgi:hypothetical protein
MKRNSRIIFGIILILLGLLFLARELAPTLFSFWEWPFFIIGLGAIFLIWAILNTTGGLAVPGAILAGIGVMFYIQDQYNLWDSWAYAWTLIPGFVGIGIITGGIIDRNYREAFSGGLTMILISTILFFAFGERFGLAPDITKFWPILLIGLGLIALVRALFTKKTKTGKR